IARAALRQSAGEPLSFVERRVLENVATRVRLWNDVGPYYHDRAGDRDKAAESRGTEAVLNALVLAGRDRSGGRLGADTTAALAIMWNLQQAGGGWPWLQFGLEPWEGADSDYYGATLAALAVGAAPPEYRSSPAIGGNLKRLRAFLDRGAARQPVFNRAMLL